MFKKQQQNFDRIFKCVTHLIYLMLKTAETEEEKEALRDAVTKLIQRQITSAGTNDTLLHLSVSRLNYIKRDIVSARPTLIENIRDFNLLIRILVNLLCR